LAAKQSQFRLSPWLQIALDSVKLGKKAVWFRLESLLRALYW